MNRILVGIIFSLFITTGYIAFLVYDRQQELQKLTQYTESWSVAQLVSEYYRFESWLGLYATDTDDVTIDQVRMRLEIMLSQSDLMNGGDLGRYIDSDKMHQELASRLEKILAYLDGNLEKMSHSELQAYLKNMHMLDAPLSQLSATALTKDINTVNESNRKIQILYYIYSALSLLLVILSFILGFLMIYQNKNILKAHMQVKSLADELQISKETLQIQNAKLEYDVYHDSLTGMKNRLFFWDDLNKINLQADKNHIPVTVMLFDLDRFKEVNDTYGHDAGDLLLNQVSRRLTSMSSATDTFYRLGGDEFALLSSGLTESAAVSRAKEISDHISQPYTINNQLIKIATCVQKLQESRTLEHDMALALDHHEFVVYYQPIVDAFSNDIYGYEALIRWIHPQKGILSPDYFISVAEKTGMINEIGKNVLELACREAVSWAVPARISVNVSPVQLGTKSFTAMVQSILKETGLPANRLELEVTESSLFSDSNTPVTILKKLRSLGVRISIDDFGTGYSSLSRLSELNFDKIKIDKSFVNPISTQDDALNIVKLIAGMAKSLNMRVIAEGVETEAQLERLQALGCDLVQGYLFGKPQAEVDKKIKSGAA